MYNLAEAVIDSFEGGSGANGIQKPGYTDVFHLIDKASGQGVCFKAGRHGLAKDKLVSLVGYLRDQHGLDRRIKKYGAISMVTTHIDTEGDLMLIVGKVFLSI